MITRYDVTLQYLKKLSCLLTMTYISQKIYKTYMRLEIQLLKQNNTKLEVVQETIKKTAKHCQIEKTTR